MGSEVKCWTNILSNASFLKQFETVQMQSQRDGTVRTHGRLMQAPHPAQKPPPNMHCSHTHS